MKAPHLFSTAAYLASASLLGIACGSSSSSSPVAGADADLAGGPDGGSERGDAAFAPPCADDGSAEIAVVAAINNYDNYDEGHVRIYALNGTGRLRDTGIQVGQMRIPQAIAMRSDGEEAVVTWGSSSEGTAHGFAIIRLQNGGGDAEMVQKTELPGEYGPLRVAYADDDTIIVGRVGPGPDDLVPLRRQSDGLFKAGTPLLVPGEYPQATRPMANAPGKSFFLQSALGSESNLYVLDHSGENLVLEENPLHYPDGPLFLYANPATARAYLPEQNPEDPGCETCNPTGILHDVSVGTDALKVHDDFIVPNRASLAAVAREGDWMALVDHVVGDPSHWSIFAVNLDSEGAPTAASDPLFAIDGSWVFQVLISPRGHVLAAAETDDHGIEVHTKNAAGEYVRCQNDVVLPGRADLAISSWPTLD